MKTKASAVAVGLLCVLLVLGGCGSSGSGNGGQDGNITVRVVNADAENGEIWLFGVFTTGADPENDDPAAFGEALISGGVAESLAVDPDTGTTVVIFPGGGKYDIYAVVDKNDDGDPTTGEPSMFTLGVEGSGDIVVQQDYSGYGPFSGF